VRGVAGIPDRTGRLHALRDRLGALCRADARRPEQRALAGKHGRHRFRETPGLASPDQVRDTRAAPGPWRLGRSVPAQIADRILHRRWCKSLDVKKTASSELTLKSWTEIQRSGCRSLGAVFCMKSLLQLPYSMAAARSDAAGFP